MNYIVLNNVKKILIITLFILFFTGKISAYAVIWENPQNINIYIPQIDDRTKLMKKAFEEWQRKTKNQFVFNFVNSVEDSDINVVFIEKNLEPYCGNIDARGCSIPFLYNGKPRETIYITKRAPKGLLLSNTQIYAIMRHEIGHSIGLEHTKNYNDIMYPMTNLGIAIRQDIRSGDLQQLYKVYGIIPRK